MAQNESLIADLPIYPHLREITQNLKDSVTHTLVLTAETASGKSTAVPIELLKAFPGKTIMLEPRRLAAIAVASRVAQILGEKCGETAGYRIHLETKTSTKTRFEVLTDAILIKFLQNDPSLDGISVVILDEFHERSLYSDLALALLKETLLLRNDLYVLVMSATINVDRISKFLNCSILKIPGRKYPVSISYKSQLNSDICKLAADTVIDTLAASIQAEGILVFLPGIAEIKRTVSFIQNKLLTDYPEINATTEIYMLHSSINLEIQKKILNLENKQINRVIISSSIAETSLTVPGITTVIDSGLSRINKFSVSTGMNRLTTQPESVFSASQRAGRAGRTAPGKCIRLWLEKDIRLTDSPPAITVSDLTNVVLECAMWGVISRDSLEWLDSPPETIWNTAVTLLKQLHCLNNDGTITKKGKIILSLGVHVRIGCIALLCTDEALEYAIKYGTSTDNIIEKKRLYDDLKNKLINIRKYETADITQYNSLQNTLFLTKKLTGNLCLLKGFADRLAQSCGDGVYMFPSGRKAYLPKEQLHSMSCTDISKWIIAPEADEGEREGRIYKWEAISESSLFEEWLLAHSKKKIETVFDTNTSTSERKLIKTEYTLYGKIIITQKKQVPQQCDIIEAWCNLIHSDGIDVLPLNKEAKLLILRAEFVALHQQLQQSQSQVSTTDIRTVLKNSVDNWFKPFLNGHNLVNEQIVLDALRYGLNSSLIDKEAPLSIKLENGKTCKLAYEQIDKAQGPQPVLEVIIQQVFGCKKIPTILGVPILLKLLSPARRPLQITTDLTEFWQTTWPQICREMKGKYPKHNWNYQQTE